MGLSGRSGCEAELGILGRSLRGGAILFKEGKSKVGGSHKGLPPIKSCNPGERKMKEFCHRN